MLDYGAVVFKNGVQINKEQYFMNMNEAVGWDDDDNSNKLDKPNKLAGNYFAYVGDSELTIAVYKYYCMVAENKNVTHEIWGTRRKANESTWNYRCNRFSIGNTNFTLRSLAKHDKVLWLQFTYKGDYYNIIYGYGIDPDFNVWNRVKVSYLGKMLARKVDNVYRRIQK